MSLQLKQTFPPIIWIFTEGEGDGIESSLPFKIFSTLINLPRYSKCVNPHYNPYELSRFSFSVIAKVLVKKTCFMLFLVNVLIWLRFFDLIWHLFSSIHWFFETSVMLLANHRFIYSWEGPINSVWIGLTRRNIKPRTSAIPSVLWPYEITMERQTLTKYIWKR